MHVTLTVLPALLVLWLGSPVLEAQEPPVIPPGWVVIDDMIVPESAVSGDAAFAATPWPGGTVYFSFDPSVSGPNSTVAIDAMAEWAASANVTFVAHTNQPNWVNFTNGTANLSYVGMAGGRQDITIYNWNYRFIVCHEIAHALGCIHEHQRPNRDNYVTVNGANIIAGHGQDFDIVAGATMNGNYDFDSLMHYDQLAFSRNGQPTITCKPAYTSFQSTMGQRLHLSVGDSLGMASRYGVAPVPIMGGIAPINVLAGASPFTLWVNGARLHAGSLDGLGVPGTRVTWNGTPLVTTYFNQLILTAQVPASLVATAGYVTVRVDNPYPCPGPGGMATFEIRNPVPTLTAIGPASTTAGAAALTLTVTGTNFNAQSAVRWNGTTLATNQIGQSQLAASVPASLITTGGYAAVTVFNPLPGGGVSAAMTFTINNPLPAIGLMSPISRPAGSGQFNLSVIYTAAPVYVPSSVIRWNGQALPTTYQSDRLTATVSAGLVASAGTALVSVFSPAPGGGSSNAATFSITQPAPVLSSIAPASAIAGGPGLILAATGAGFTAQSVVQWNGATLPTVWGSAAQLTATVGASLVATAGAASVTGFTPAPGGGSSVARTFSVDNPLPSIAALSPASKPVGASAFVLTVSGANFNAQSVIEWDGAPRATTLVDPGTLQASIPATLVGSAATVPIAVQNPAPGGGTSASLTFSVNNPVPSLTSLNPSSFTAGANATTIVVYGSQLNSQTVVRWNGTDLPGTFAAFILPHVTAMVSAALIEAPGTVTVALHNPGPGGGDSAPSTVDILAPRITGLAPAAIPVLGASSPPVAIVVTTQRVLSGAQFFANGVAVSSTQVSGQSYSIQVGPAVSQTQLPGAVAITVENGSHATSNARALVVGGGNNAGTVVTHPSSSSPLPGTPFSLVIEGGVPGAPFSLLVDASTAPVVTGWPTPVAGLVLAVGTPAVSCPVDGLGLFQPAVPFAVFGSSSSADAGSFSFPGLMTADPPLGFSATLQVAYLDPASPAGFRLTWAASPRSL